MYYNGQGVEEDEKKSLELFKEAAEAGDVNSMNMLALQYRNGCGCAVDSDKSFYWQEKAAKSGNSYATVKLGLHYLKGIGTEQNFEKGLELLRQKARPECECGVLAMFWIGRCYEMGRGVEPDFDKAMEWYEKALEHKSEEARYRFALLYAEGIRVPEDREKAMEYCRSVSENLEYSNSCDMEEELEQQIQKLLEELRAEQGL